MVVFFKEERGAVPGISRRVDPIRKNLIWDEFSRRELDYTVSRQSKPPPQRCRVAGPDGLEAYQYATYAQVVAARRALIHHGARAKGAVKPPPTPPSAAGLRPEAPKAKAAPRASPPPSEPKGRPGSARAPRTGPAAAGRPEAAAPDEEAGRTSCRAAAELHPGTSDAKTAPRVSLQPPEPKLADDAQMPPGLLQLKAGVRPRSAPAARPPKPHARPAMAPPCDGPAAVGRPVSACVARSAVGATLAKEVSWSLCTAAEPLPEASDARVRGSAPVVRPPTPHAGPARAPTPRAGPAAVGRPESIRAARSAADPAPDKDISGNPRTALEGQLTRETPRAAPAGAPAAADAAQPESAPAARRLLAGAAQGGGHETAPTSTSSPASPSKRREGPNFEALVALKSGTQQLFPAYCYFSEKHMKFGDKAPPPGTRPVKPAEGAAVTPFPMGASETAKGRPCSAPPGRRKILC